jgi:hypothetical protein
MHDHDHGLDEHAHTHDGGHSHTHNGGHSHAHNGGHGPAAGGENYSARAHPEPVVLDIGAAGGDVGGEAIATGQDDCRTHKDVLEREISGRPAYTAVFDKLREGTYTLWVEGAARARNVGIMGAEVAQLDWSGAGMPSAASPSTVSAPPTPARG